MAQEWGGELTAEGEDATLPRIKESRGILRQGRVLAQGAEEAPVEDAWGEGEGGNPPFS